MPRKPKATKVNIVPHVGPRRSVLAHRAPLGDWVPPAAGSAAYIVHTREAPLPLWVVGVETLAGDSFGGGVAPGSIPDLSVDPETGLLSVINESDGPKTFFVTVGHACMGGDGTMLARAESHSHGACTTFVCVLEATTVLDVCFVNVNDADPETGLDISSDVRPLSLPLDDSEDHGVDADGAAAVAAIEGRRVPIVLPVFPLGGAGPFLCTQGHHGRLSHFFAETLHAVDFACAEGTSVLAVGDGVVVSVQDANTASGIHCHTLFHWNSVMLHVDSGAFVEYVHIAAGSAAVAVGQRVVAGQVLAASGAVGFCPEPHLHVQAHYSSDASAPTAPFSLVAMKTGTLYVPVPGMAYTPAHGPIGSP